MTKRIVSQSRPRNQVRPSDAYPEVFNKLARIAILTRELHAETTDQAIADVLAIAHQSVNTKIKTIKKKGASK